jgi:hypothetical protein
MLADLLVSKSNCSPVQLLDHIRVALIRKRGPKPASIRLAMNGRLGSTAMGGNP